VRHLQRVGHFEFGLDRRPINVDDVGQSSRVSAAWGRGEELEGWSLYWAQVYGYLADRLATNSALREAALVVRFEDMCRAPEETLQRALTHCQLDAARAWLSDKAALIRFPSYYRPRFTADELATVERHTAATARRFGYPVRSESLGQSSDDQAAQTIPDAR
jgi:hypothetical protein